MIDENAVARSHFADGAQSLRIAYSVPVTLDAPTARAAAGETARFQRLLIETETAANA